MAKKAKKLSRCIGYGEYEGKCDGVPWEHSPYWCERCDRLRGETIRKQIDMILERFERLKQM